MLLGADESMNQSRFQSLTPQKNAKGTFAAATNTNTHFFLNKNLNSLGRSPLKNHNGRDNTEAIDMEMSDEDYDTVPEFQSNFSFIFLVFSPLHFFCCLSSISTSSTTISFRLNHQKHTISNIIISIRQNI